MVYIASLIDKINIDFNYNFKSSENINLNFNYDIIGKLVISDSEGKNVYYKKEYTLLENKKIPMISNNNQNISENIVIDYDYYNNLANNFKMTFGVDTTSNLIIYLTINKSDDDNQATNANSIMQISIPLSEKAININPSHISAYSYDAEDTGYLKGFENDDTLFLEVEKICEQNGYLKYETSNFAKAGKQSIHNSLYWQANEYAGIGVSAHSMVYVDKNERKR